MPKSRRGLLLGQITMKLRAAWNIYWYVIVQGALAVDGKWKQRKRQKESGATPPRTEHPRTTRLRKELNREKDEKAKKDKDAKRPE